MARRSSGAWRGKADVVVENFAAGVMDRLGLGWEVLRQENPRLVYASGTGFGLSGPYRDLPAMDLTIQAMSGIMNATGYADRPPVKAGPAVCDFLGGVHLFAGVMSALMHRERTGQGQFVEVAMLDAAVLALASALGVFMDGDAAIPPRTGNRHPALAMAPYNVYETSDGHVAIFTASDRHWESIAHVLGRADLLTNPDYATTPGRAAKGDDIDAMVTAWTRQHTKDEVLAILTEAHVPCAPVQDHARGGERSRTSTSAGCGRTSTIRGAGRPACPTRPSACTAPRPAPWRARLPCWARTPTASCRSCWA